MMEPFENQNQAEADRQDANDSQVAFRRVDLDATDYYHEEGKRSDLSAELVRRYQDDEEELAGGFAKIITSRMEGLLALGKLV